MPVLDRTKISKDCCQGWQEAEVGLDVVQVSFPNMSARDRRNIP